jgi:hypothetical protein
VSARIGMAAALARVWRRLRTALHAVPPDPASFRDEPTPELAAEIRRILGEAENGATVDLSDAEPEAPPETEPVAEPLRRHRCGYPIRSVGCRNTCGDGAA